MDFNNSLSSPSIAVLCPLCHSGEVAEAHPVCKCLLFQWSWAASKLDMCSPGLSAWYFYRVGDGDCSNMPFERVLWLHGSNPVTGEYLCCRKPML